MTSTASLSTAERDKLLAILRKTLESVHDGEAIAMLGMLRKEAAKRNTSPVELIEQVVGTRIREVVRTVVQTQTVYKTREVYKPLGWEEPESLAHGLTIALRFVDRKVLNPFEEKFANDCAGHSNMTEKQQAVAQKIIDKVRKYARA